MNDDSLQKQTERAFSYKWKKRDTYESDAVQAEWRRWLIEKYFDGDTARLVTLLGTGTRRLRILDAGCGSGGSALVLFGNHLRHHDYLGVDISDAVEIARTRFAEAGMPGAFRQLDLNDLDESVGSFDVIFSEGVLHHTDSVRDAIARLTDRLADDGVMMFYVYAKKAPVREFTDDFIRDRLAGFSDEETWSALLPLSELGRALGELQATIEVTHDVPLLGIKRGVYDVQRLLYYHFFKAYYRSDYSLDEMNHINFDWYRPSNCHRHTPEEIQAFCDECGLVITRLHVEESGITVIAQRQGNRRT